MTKDNHSKKQPTKEEIESAENQYQEIKKISDMNLSSAWFQGVYGAYATQISGIDSNEIASYVGKTQKMDPFAQEYVNGLIFSKQGANGAIMQEKITAIIENALMNLKTSDVAKYLGISEKEINEEWKNLPVGAFGKDPKENPFLRLYRIMQSSKASSIYSQGQKSGLEEILKNPLPKQN